MLRSFEELRARSEAAEREAEERIDDNDKYLMMHARLVGLYAAHALTPRML